MATAQDGQDQLGPKCPAPEVSVPEFDGDLKIHLLPSGRNDMLIRLENLADLFDGTPGDTPMFNLKQYCLNLFAANYGGQVQLDIKERTLSDN